MIEPRRQCQQQDPLLHTCWACSHPRLLRVSTSWFRAIKHFRAVSDSTIPIQSPLMSTLSSSLISTTFMSLFPNDCFTPTIHPLVGLSCIRTTSGLVTLNRISPTLSSQFSSCLPIVITGHKHLRYDDPLFRTFLINYVQLQNRDRNWRFDSKLNVVTAPRIAFFSI